MNYYQIWTNSPLISLADKQTIRQFSQKEKERLFANPPFITYYWRAPLGLGSAFFNKYNLQILAQALLAFFQTSNQKLKTVLIFHDNRSQSLEASQVMANFFLYQGIKVYFAPGNQPVPSPFLSYCLKKSKGNYQLGLMITASHNEAKFNGCKFIYGNGIPFNPQDCQKIRDYLLKNYASFFQHSPFFTSKKPQEIAFQEKVNYFNSLLKSEKLNLFFQTKAPTPFQIYYSPLNGVGQGWTDQLLKQAGFNPLLIEEHSQNQLRDCQFENIVDHTPNPEIDGNFEKAYQRANQAKVKTKYDLIVINDGDVDRMRVACRLSEGTKFHLFSGNEIALLFTHCLLFLQKQTGTIFRTEVSTFLIDEMITKLPHLAVVTTGIGFNNLGQQYGQTPNPLFAFEESTGFLLDFTITGDKDGLQAALFITNLARFLAVKKGINLWEYLQQIYQKFDKFWSFTKKNDLSSVLSSFQSTVDFSTHQIEIVCSCYKEGKVLIFYRWSSTEKSLLKIYFQGKGEPDDHHCFDRQKLVAQICQKTVAQNQKEN